MGSTTQHLWLRVALPQDCHSTFCPPRERNWVTSELPLDRRLKGMVLKVLVRDSPEPYSTPSELVFRDRAKALKQSPVCSLLNTFTYMHASNLHVELRELVESVLSFH